MIRERERGMRREREREYLVVSDDARVGLETVRRSDTRKPLRERERERERERKSERKIKR